MKILIDQFVLAAGDAESPSGLKINGKIVAEIAPRLRAMAVRAFDRANLQTSITFKITREHADTRICEAFILRHAVELPRSGLVKFSAADTRGGESDFFLADAVIESDEGEQIGATSIHTYTILGGAISILKPV